MAKQKPRGDNHAARHNRRKRRVRGDRVPPEARLDKPLPCAECGKQEAELVNGERIYPHRVDLHRRSFWLCACGAYCGCHAGTTFPLGAPAGLLTRRARNAAHDAFDPLWQIKAVRDSLPTRVARNAGYLWLAGELGLDVKDCHISHMTATQAMRVVEVCERARADARAATAAKVAAAASIYRTTERRADGSDETTKRGTTA